MDAFVRTEVDERGVGTITFFHPASNSLPAAILKQLADHVSDAGRRDDIKVIVLKSAGDRAFCAGASFDELVAISNEEEGLAFFSGFALVINAIGRPKFVIGRVQGKPSVVVWVWRRPSTIASPPNASVKFLNSQWASVHLWLVLPSSENGHPRWAPGHRRTRWKSAHWAAQRLYAEVFDTAEEWTKPWTVWPESLPPATPRR